MSKKLYVGNLSYSVSDRELEDLFRPYGKVTSANVIMDRVSGRSKGFAFVEMSSDQEARAAISALHGKDIEGKSLTVNEARPREERSGGGKSHFGTGRRY
ncbi:MAG: RNA recognition motif domain-containing protein [Methylococcales bacterium]